MVRAFVFVRDLVIALALGWIGVTLEPVAEKSCPAAGADSAPSLCRGPGFEVAGFGVELARDGACPNS
jgi:hypothetical protein